MRQVFRIAAAIAVGLASGTSEAVEVRGTLQVQPRTVDSAPRVPGYIRTRVSAASPLYAVRTPDHALFLQVEDSLPLEQTGVSPSVELRGFLFKPEVVSCAVDSTVTFVNRNPKTRTLVVGGTELPLKPGQSTDWTCTSGVSGPELKRVTLKDYPFARAAIYVGEVGVAALPRPDGGFSLDAVQGRYELLLIGAEGVVDRRPVTVERRSVDLGEWSVGGS